MDQLGKTIFKQLTNDDIPLIEEFCIECSKLGYENNISLEAMKFDSAIFFGAFKNNQLFSLAGVHKFPEINDHAYRCLFRGAQLPGHTPKWSMNLFESGIHFSQFMYMQIKHILTFDESAEFYITTNIDNLKAGASTRLHKTMMPRMAEKGYWNLVNANMLLYSTQQSVWKINVNNYIKDREIYLDKLNQII
jgi:hypothetical protein